jgi:hypothetical protein
MERLLDKMLGGKTLREALRDDALAIHRIGDDHRVKTFNTQVVSGYVTARMHAVPVDEQHVPMAAG